MTKNLALVLALLGMLAACGGGDGTNPVNRPGGDDDDDTDIPIDPGDPETEIPSDLALNVTQVTYNAGTDPDSDADDTLTVELSALDQSPKAATYLRNAALDVEGYKAFSVQDDPLDRMFVAVSTVSDDGTVTATAVSDGGQFGKFFRGGYYKRNGGDNVPTTGLVSYAGTYAGVTNENDLDQDQRLEIPEGTNGALYPYQPRQTEGKIYVNVDFDDNAVNGAIYEKQFSDTGETLPNVNLVEGVIDDNGEFLGVTEIPTASGPTSAGKFGGIIGNNGDAIAGVVAMDTIYQPDDTRDGSFDREVGAFVLPRCGTADAPAICDDVDDFD